MKQQQPTDDYTLHPVKRQQIEEREEKQKTLDIKMRIVKNLLRQKIANSTFK